ncbi:MAG: hypothetical protein HC905_15620, partial [Bacteroidales bacterium]|nr:hypothetical protein [Bacteroidales bacterium]
MYFISFRDITRNKQVMLDLKTHQGWLERAESKAQLGYWEYDVESKKIWGSPGARTIYGLNERE